ncbi:hypothetical protein [Hyphococcus sp.]|uniref:hypothetical protein n=1 Tax=Hyphococcus sp. TaxID=2038636 RepID=UPI003CCBE8F3
MAIAHRSNAQREGASAHRNEGIAFEHLLVGEEGTKDNFILTIVTTEDEYKTPRHRHNFEQIRYVLKGEMQYGPGEIQREGAIAYFCEGVSYQQKGSDGSETLLLQFAGPSGQGYMSQRQLRAGARELQAKGTFEDGVFVWDDEHAGKKKQDGYEAVWEHVNGKDVKYCNPRYVSPIIMNPDSFDYIQLRGHAGVAQKLLGRFNERGAEIHMIKMEPGAEYALAAPERPLVVAVMHGEGAADGEVYGPLSAFRVLRKEQVQLAAEFETELFIIGLPSFDD